MSRDANFWNFLEAKLRATGEAVAFEEANGLSITYATLAEQVGRASAGLMSIGLKPGDRVIAQTTKSISSVVLYLATLRIGGIFTPLRPATTADDFVHCLDNALPTLAVADAQMLARIANKLRSSRVRVALSLEADGSGAFTDMVKSQQPARASAPRGVSDPALLIHAPAVDGRVRGIIHTHKSLAANALALQATWPIQAGDIVLHALDDWHTQGLSAALHSALLGNAHTLLAHGFDDALVHGQLARASVWLGAPQDYEHLLAMPAFDKAHTANLRLAATTAPYLARSLHQGFLDRTGVPVRKSLSLPETGVICADALTGDTVADCVGPTLPDIAARVRNAVGEATQSGLLEVAGANVSPGYWRDAKTSGQAFTEDGYLRTQIRATRCADGSLSILDPVSDSAACRTGTRGHQP